MPKMNATQKQHPIHDPENEESQQKKQLVES